MFYSKALVALVAVSGASALVPRGFCNSDNCFRALKAASPATRLAQAQADCASWLMFTSTPVKTVTEYSTIIESLTHLELATSIDTIHDIFTTTIHETSTETVYTATTTFTTEPVVLTKRAAGPIIPAYASPCSGAVRYSSACSCIGASSAKTIVAPTSTTTVTIPTAAQTDVPVTSVAATSTTIVYDSTVTVTVIEPGTTISAVSTTTVPKPSEVPGRIQITAEGRTPAYMIVANLNGRFTANYVATATNPSSFTLKQDGTLWYGGRVACGNINGGMDALFFVLPTQLWAGVKPFTCTTSSGGILTCEIDNAGNSKFGLHNGNALVSAVYIAKPGDIKGPYYQAATLRLT